MSYMNINAYEKAEGQKNTLDVYEQANSLAEALASGAPEMDGLSAWEDEDGCMKIYFTEACPSIAMELPMP